MNKLISTLFILFTLALAPVMLDAQQSFDPSGTWWYLKGAIPATSTVVVNRTVKLHQLNLMNTSASPVTVTIVDHGTACNGGPCQITPGPITIDGNHMWVMDKGGEVEDGGFSWSASTANVIHAFVSGN